MTTVYGTGPLPRRIDQLRLGLPDGAKLAQVWVNGKQLTEAEAEALLLDAKRRTQGADVPLPARSTVTNGERSLSDVEGSTR